jgi:hypothetical protein
MTNGVDRPVGKHAGHDFAFDLKYGQEGEEAVIANLLDIRDGNGKVEVKRKRKRDITVYVEVEQRKIGTSCYVPSGISTTEASNWFFVVDETGCSFSAPVQRIRNLIAWACPRLIDGGLDGENPTRGILFPFDWLLNPKNDGVLLNPTHKTFEYKTTPAPRHYIAPDYHEDCTPFTKELS